MGTQHRADGGDTLVDHLPQPVGERSPTRERRRLTIAHINPWEECMFTRRTFLSLVAGGVAVPRWASAQPASGKVALYANVGADLTHYDVDVAGAELTKR